MGAWGRQASAYPPYLNRRKMKEIEESTLNKIFDDSCDMLKSAVKFKNKNKEWKLMTRDELHSLTFMVLKEVSPDDTFCLLSDDIINRVFEKAKSYDFNGWMSYLLKTKK